jgi:PAS domain S-box-containing protein
MIESTANATREPGPRPDEAERDAALEAAESDRRWLRTVLDTMPLGVLLFQPDGRLFFNRRTEELLGTKLSPTGGSAQYAGRVLFPDGTPVPPEELLVSRVLRDGKTIIAAEFRVRRDDGTQIPVLSSAAPIRDADGRVIGGVGVFQDMSERMRMEQAIRASERLLRGIFDILPVGVWIADETGRIVSNNPAGERIWRGARYVPVAEFGQYKGWWADTGKPIAAEEWALARALTRGETSSGELVRIQCFDGSFKTIINSAAPLRDENGEIAGAIVVNEDITALQHTQEQLRAAVRDREEILAVVTHDLRNPLSGLSMAATALERKLRDLPGGEPLRAVASSLVDIARRMSGMVDDLLAVAVAATGGRSMLKLDPVAASSLLERAAQTARPHLAKESLQLEIKVTGELPTIHADADRVLRVFSNLLDNALKFTSPPGRVTLAAEPTAGGVRFCVANSGPPLSAAQLEAMFQPFWQAARDRRGAGLGLSICRSIVEAHGGSIWAEPVEGERVRVCFVLPRQPAPGA